MTYEIGFIWFLGILSKWELSNYYNYHSSLGSNVIEIIISIK